MLGRNYKRILGFAGLVLLLVLLVGMFVPQAIPDSGGSPIIGADGRTNTLVIGHVVHAAGELDYTCDGTDDNVQWQLALNALPNDGGKLVVLSANYSFSSNVTRAIDNVTIQGMGRSTYVALDGSNPVIVAGGDNWAFRDFATDAGGVYTIGTTGWLKENVLQGSVYYALQVAGDILPNVNATRHIGSETGGWYGVFISDNGTLHLGSKNMTATDILGLSPSQGDVFFYNGSDIIALGPGTLGEFLQTQGAGQNPQWADATGVSGNITPENVDFSGTLTKTPAFKFSDLGDEEWFCNPADIANVTAGENIAIGQIVFMASDGDVELGIANATATMPILYIALEAITSGNDGRVLSITSGGYYCETSWSETPGTLAYADNETAGLITSNVPGGSGDQVQILGIFVESDVLKVGEVTWLEVP